MNQVMALGQAPRQGLRAVSRSKSLREASEAGMEESSAEPVRNGTSERKSESRTLNLGERGRIRTCDPCLKRALLYQLSYAPHLCSNSLPLRLRETVPLRLDTNEDYSIKLNMDFHEAGKCRTGAGSVPTT